MSDLNTPHPEKAPFPDGSFTPGPWRVDYDNDVVGPDGTGIASVHGEWHENEEANARMIAAAPDMFDIAASFPGFAADPKEMAAWNKRRLAALSKATGGQHV